jgi:hypothetical protein
MKKLSVVLLASCVVFLGACGSKKADTPASTAAPTPMGTTSVAPGASTTVAADPTTVAGAALPSVVACKSSKPEVRPTTVFFDCFNHSATLNKIVWNAYGATTATGTASLNDLDCTPNCADGKRYDYPVTVTLSNPGAFNGKSIFKTVSWTYTGSRPTDVPKTVTNQLPADAS